MSRLELSELVKNNDMSSLRDLPANSDRNSHELPTSLVCLVPRSQIRVGIEEYKHTRLASVPKTLYLWVEELHSHCLTQRILRVAICVTEALFFHGCGLEPKRSHEQFL